MLFRATLELGGKTATGIEIPGSVVDALGSHQRPAVRLTVNGYSYRSTVARRAGRFLVPVSAEVRTAAGIAAGDEIDVEIELDDAPRELTVPDDLAAALDTAGARARFDALSFTNRKENVRAVEAAKTAATRERRIVAAVQKLSS